MPGGRVALPGTAAPLFTSSNGSPPVRGDIRTKHKKEEDHDMLKKWVSSEYHFSTIPEL